jgi:hypothetical protein
MTWTSDGTVQADGVAAATGMIAVDQTGDLQVYGGSSWKNLG